MEERVVHIVRSGLVAGLVLSGLMFGPGLLFGARPEWMSWSEIVGYTSMILCMTSTFFAMRSERERRGGKIAFGSALAVGAGVSAVGALVFGVATWLFYVLAGDALPEALIGFYEDKIRASGGTAQEIERALAEMEQMKPFLYNKPLQALVMFATVFLIGVAESVIGAFLVRSRRV
jgi:hypothetical protein